RAGRARAVVHGGSGGEGERLATLHGDAREGAVPALHEESAVRLGRAAAERGRQGRRRADRARPERDPQGRRGKDRLRVSRPRAAIVVTGSELVRGERTDRNGPFYAREALSLGLVPDRILI